MNVLEQGSCAFGNQDCLSSLWQACHSTGSSCKCFGNIWTQCDLFTQVRMVHTELPEWPCPDCGKKFKRKFDLNRHRVTVHLGVRNFPCDLCGKRFADMKDMTRHKNAVHYGMKIKWNSRKVKGEGGGSRSGRGPAGGKAGHRMRREQREMSSSSAEVKLEDGSQVECFGSLSFRQITQFEFAGVYSCWIHWNSWNNGGWRRNPHRPQWRGIGGQHCHPWPCASSESYFEEFNAQINKYGSIVMWHPRSSCCEFTLFD